MPVLRPFRTKQENIFHLMSYGHSNAAYEHKEDKRMSSVERIYLSVKEAKERLQNMEPEEMARVMAISKTFAPGTGMLAEDLLQEAITRTLEGTRNMPADTAIVPFLYKSMQSIAFHARDNVERKHLRYASELATNEDDSDSSSVFEKYLGDERCNPLKEVEADQFIGSLIEQFFDDQEVFAVIRSQIEGLTREEGCEKTGLSLKEYSAALRRLRRGIDPHYGKRTKSNV